MPLYDYRCESGHLTETLRPMSVSRITCGCGAMAERQVSAGVQVIGPTTDTRGMYRRYSEASAEMAHQGRNPSSLWPAAKSRAQAMVAAGESPLPRKD